MTKRAPTVDAFIRGAGLFDPPAIIAHAGLVDGDPVIVAREPDNPKDSNAIVASNKDDQPIGYIGREYAAILAPWMDRGWLYTAKVIQAAEVIKRRHGRIELRYVQKDTLIVRCTPIEPAKKATDISIFNSLLTTNDKVKVKELEDV